MNLLMHPTYFPNIAHFVAISQAGSLTFEKADNFQKQSYRNRSYIYAANGKQLLNIPVVHTQKNRQQYAHVLTCNTENWQRNHWRSLETAYRTSPFFEFYEDDIAPLFKAPVTRLFDFNMACIETVLDCMQYNLPYKTTTVYQKNPEQQTDLRFLADVKATNNLKFEPYNQVFNTKHGYINNLSILDLLFNEGPNSINYLQAQKAFW
ncbi:WbqC family protein [Bizionia sediminis]|uniref:WbqC family protein n=1 Tax=Bizionia sediminis TaxID=1737064 RepID=A0ABW5KNZ5_9FLAO